MSHFFINVDTWDDMILLQSMKLKLDSSVTLDDDISTNATATIVYESNALNTRERCTDFIIFFSLRSRFASRIVCCSYVRTRHHRFGKCSTFYRYKVPRSRIVTKRHAIRGRTDVDRGRRMMNTILRRGRGGRDGCVGGGGGGGRLRTVSCLLLLVFICGVVLKLHTFPMNYIAGPSTCVETSSASPGGNGTCGEDVVVCEEEDSKNWTISEWTYVEPNCKEVRYTNTRQQIT